MLKKLYKYDWKSVSMFLLLLHGILLIYTLIGRIGLAITRTRFFDSSNIGTNAVFDIVSGLYFMIYVFFISSILIATVIYLAIRIQKSLFSDEGYLTHTLPVTPAKLLLSKLFIYWTWTAIDLICVAGSLLLLFSSKETLPFLKTVFGDIFHLLSGSAGTDGQITAILTLLCIIVQYFGYYSTLLLFSMCLGSLFKNHKILGAVISGCGIHMVLSMCMSIFILLINPHALIRQANTLQTIDNLMGYALIWTIVFTIVFFLGSKYILSKKLNLE